MKLINYVKYRNTLQTIVSSKDDDLDFMNIRRQVFLELTNFNSKLNLDNLDIKNIKQNMILTQQEIEKNLELLYSHLNRFIEELNKMIADLEPTYHEISKEISLADQNKSLESKEHSYDYGHLFISSPYTEREPSVPKKKFIGTMLKSVNFKWPGLELGPVTGELTKNLVPLDPLYLADNIANRFSRIKKLWNSQYQRRLRYYVVDDNLEDPLKDFPKNQLGFIVAVDWFNYKTQTVIERYVRSAFDILAPGGVMLFTYNNCNYPKAIDKVDKMHYTYTNGKTLKKFCESIGFKIISSYDGEKEINWAVSWLELKKPGKRTSLRGGQNLAAINRLYNGDNE